MSTIPPLQLPPEIIHHILDDLGLESVIRAGHTCRAWRLVARTHPTYSRDIWLRVSQGVSNYAVEFFLDRITALPEGPLVLVLTLLLDDASARSRMKRVIRATVLPALTRSLSRLVTLSILCEKSLIPDMLAALRTGPAPRLTEFAFDSNLDEDINHTVPRDVFSGRSPKLWHLELGGCYFPAVAAPAFSAVRRLEYHFNNHGSIEEHLKLHPERFFINCPALEGLWIWAESCCLTDISWDACPIPNITQLRRLAVNTVNTSDDTELVVRTLAHAGMTSVDVDTTDVNLDTLALMFDHLNDSASLELDVIGDDILYCSLYDAERHRRRTTSHVPTVHFDPFVDGPEGNVEQVLAPALSAVARRLARVSLWDRETVWQFLLSLSPHVPLDAVEILTLTVDSELWEDPETEQGDLMRLPGLKRIELVAMDGAREVRVPVTQLVLLLGMLGCIADRKLTLALKAVCLDGDMQLVEGYFEEIDRSASIFLPLPDWM